MEVSLRDSSDEHYMFSTPSLGQGSQNAIVGPAVHVYSVSSSATQGNNRENNRATQGNNRGNNRPNK